MILLGDETNRIFASRLADFESFESFAACDKVAEFDRVFKVIQGERHRFTKHQGVEIWLKFVFRRWFLIEEFLRRKNINAFWTFDSDTLIVEALGPRENRYADVAATTQCRGECLNGWVGSFDLVTRYTSFILELFRDDAFLESQREWHRLHAGLAFNEMNAFREFREKHQISTRHAAEVIKGEAFDDALAFIDNYEQADAVVLGKTVVKKLWTSPLGGVWARTEGEHVRLLTCNMSWMPDHLWRRILACVKRQNNQALQLGSKKRALIEIDLAESLLSTSLRRIARICWRLRQWLLKTNLC